ncbi:MAG: bifunctional acetaldehyde-CoA/alcohol dehydrogenase [Planctomycetota bacterium]|nr:bifunctional acetaldehyde-CoA/alcohol dehydrogenase [Planctomycetota bacterium]
MSDAKQKEVKKESAGEAKPPIDLEALVERTRRAQRIFADFPQEKVDEIFRSAAIAANQSRIRLAKMAVEETGMGIVEDKVIKNHFAAEFIYNKYKDVKTCGLVEEDKTYGIHKVAEPIGIIAGVIPTTNPTSTAIFKALITLKTRNGIIFSPHPRAKRCTVEAARTIHDAAVAAGAPEGIIGWIEDPTVELSGRLMQHPHVNLILATGGPGMVRAAYTSGKPAIGVGAGNTPAVIDETADIQLSVSSILLSKTFDNGVICASEQSVVVVDAVYEKVKKEFAARGAFLVQGSDKKKLASVILKEDGGLNAAIVGQPAHKIAEMAGIKTPNDAKVLIAEAERISDDECMAHEKLSPVLGMYRAKDFDEAVDKAKRLIEFGGMGHTGVLYTDPANSERIAAYGDRMPVGRVLINMPASQGAIGDIYNFRLEPSLTLGCGSWGGNSVSENVGIRHLMNFKTVAERRENMLWFKVPPKVYHKYGCLPFALAELNDRKRAFIVTDKPLYDLGYTLKVQNVLEKMGMACETFFEIKPDPELADIEKGLSIVNAFKPDVIIALGGGSPIDAAKIMWLMYEYPGITFANLAMRFMDIMKRIYTFPTLGKKALMVAIPTTSGTGSEVTPFAVVTDNRTGTKYPIADYELTPDMAIIDSELVMSMPKGLCAASGIDALTHSIESFVSAMSTEYANAMALESARLIFKYLPDSYNNADVKSRSKMHTASCMAGMAFANAFLGVCHSMAHKLGGTFHIPHGVANAILITHVIRYNSTDVPLKQATFPQYAFPEAKARYARMADYLGFHGKTQDDKVENLIVNIEKLRDTVKIPSTIQGAGIDEKDFLAQIDQLSELAFDDQCTGANPRYPLIREIKDIYLKAYYGK